MTKVEWFAGRLKELREAAGMTQAQLAEKANLHLQAVVKLERGEYGPTWETVISLCDALGVECAAFTVQPAARLPQGRGRPPKAKLSERVVKKPRGRPKKEK